MNNPTVKLFLSDLEARRRAMGMPWEILAARSGASRAMVCRLLKNHQISAGFDKVVAVAEALGVTMNFDRARMHSDPVDIDVLLEQQAERKARRLVGMVQGTMGLEAQALDENDVAQLVKKTARRLLTGSKRRLWSD
jgi:hypothetical protein